MNFSADDHMSKTQETKSTCEHKWSAIETTQEKSHVKLRCVKCGEIKEIELFP
jgi:Fe2+ or Zn2+ uptake regulation protein